MYGFEGVAVCTIGPIYRTNHIAPFEGKTNTYGGLDLCSVKVGECLSNPNSNKSALGDFSDPETRADTV